MNTRPQTRLRRWTTVLLLATIPLLTSSLITSVLGGASDRTGRIPALIVNNDEMVTTTLPDGTSTPLLAGRLIVTELTGPSSTDFSWSLANQETADQALADGTAYAVLTIPSDFSKSIASLSSAAPQQAAISLVTDDAHSYLAGALAGQLGTVMTAQFGQTITNQYLTGLYTQLDSSLSSAASGAGQLASGSADLHRGLISFSNGVSQAASGAAAAASGVSSFVNGVSQYTGGVDALATNLAQAGSTAGYVARNWQFICPDPNTSLADCPLGQDMTVGLLTQLLTALEQGGLGAQAISSQSAALQQGGAQASAGVSSLASGLAAVNDGASQLTGGAGQLATGAEQLAAGLQQGSSVATEPTASAQVVSQPIALSSTVQHPVGSLKNLVGLLAIPAAVWLGALALYVVFPAFRSSDLQGTRSSLGIVAGALGRRWVFAAVQGALAVGVAVLSGIALQAGLWALAVAVTSALAFVALHALFALLWPRVSGLISMLLLIAQLVMLPGVLPSELLPDWVQAIAHILPLNWAMTAMQAISAGTGTDHVILSCAGLVAVGVLAGLVTTLALSRRRLADGFGFVVAEAA